MKTLISITLAALAATAHCQTTLVATATADTTLTDVRTIYRWSDGSRAYRPYRESVGKIDFVGIRTGALSSPEARFSLEDIDNYPDDNDGMFQSMVLSENLGFVQLVYSVIRWSDMKIVFSETLTSPIILLKGTWRDYLAGQTIEFILSPGDEGWMDAKVALRIADENGAKLKSSLVFFDPAFAGLEVSSTIDIFEFDGYIYSANLDEITMSTSQLRIKTTTNFAF